MEITLRASPNYVGLNLKLGRIKGNCLIYGGGITSLKDVEVTDYGINLGTAITINELEEKLKEIETRVEGKYYVYLSCLSVL